MVCGWRGGGDLGYLYWLFGNRLELYFLQCFELALEGLEPRFVVGVLFREFVVVDGELRDL